MALRQIMLNTRIEKKRAELKALEEKDTDFTTREAELETAIEEAETDEEQETVNEKIEEFEKEKKEHDDKKEGLASEISDLERELEEAEKEPETKERKKKMANRRMNRKFFGMDTQQRDAFFADEQVKEFLERAREIGRVAAANKRTITGAELTIPEVVLDLIREVTKEYSKLIGKVRLRQVSGKARQNVMGTIPEAVWTEMCARLNEIEFGFTQTEVDGYKVGGIIYICVATLEDSDYNLATEIITALGIANASALDKAILYGIGTKMPLGIVTRLAQDSEPSDYPANARPWVDLSDTNLIKIDSAKHGLDFYKEIVLAGGKAKGKYASGVKFWAMNENTYTTLKVEAMNFNAAGAIIAVQDGTMPVAGGEIVILSDDIIADNNIVAGYGELYLLAERAGAAFARSDEYRFADDQVAFKGTARYDGQPVIAEGFIAIGIGIEPATSAKFTGDTANDATLESLAIGTETLSPTFEPGKYDYTITATGTSGEVQAVATQEAATVTLKYDGKKVNNGAKLTFDGTKTLEVTVKNGSAKMVYTVEITKAAG